MWVIDSQRLDFQHLDSNLLLADRIAPPDTALGGIAERGLVAGFCRLVLGSDFARVLSVESRAVATLADVDFR